MITIILFSNSPYNSTRHTSEAIEDLVQQCKAKYPNCITYDKAKQQIIYNGPMLPEFKTLLPSMLVWSKEPDKLRM